MREQRGHLSAEELRELNEFTVEDERVPSPEQIESNDADHEADVRNHLNQPTKKACLFPFKRACDKHE